MNKEEDIIQELQKTGRILMDLELAWGTSGNISARKNDDQYYITASGSNLGNLATNDLILYPSEDNIDRRPSKEYRFHEAIYTERPDINVILHSSPFYSTLLSCSSIDIPSNYFIESMYYLERIARVPYAHPGTTDLSAFVKEKAKLANIFLLENHGVIVCDVNIKEAIMALQTLEFTSKLLITSMQSNIPLRELSREVVDDFLNNARYKPRRQWETQ